MSEIPAQEGFSMPAEWEPHSGCFISFPCKEQTWCGFFKEAKRAYIDVIKTINRFEPVIILSDPSTVKEAREVLGPDIKIIEIPLDDSWIRDNGPIFVTSDSKKVAMIQFDFNGWGEHYLPYEKDAKVPELLEDHLKIRRYVAPMVLEGGAICVDGEGTLLTTESCLLNANRNPNISREQIERILGDYLGVKKVLWVERGIYESTIDGHIDGIAAFVAPKTVIHAYTDDKSDPNHEIMKDNIERLETMTDAKGRSIEIIKFPMPVRREIDGNQVVPCYTNFFIAKDGIVAPTFGDPNDPIALEILRNLFPKYDVVGVRCEFIGVGGGEVHCITQQIPAGIPILP